MSNERGGGVAPPLPCPVTREQAYLAAILDELRALRAQLAEPTGGNGNLVDLQEPAEAMQPPARRRAKR